MSNLSQFFGGGSVPVGGIAQLAAYQDIVEINSEMYLMSGKGVKREDAQELPFWVSSFPAKWENITTISTTKELNSIGSNGSTWMVGARDLTLYRSTNKGKTWTQITVPTTGWPNFHGVASNGSVWVAIATNSNSFRSIDDGLSWSSVPLPTSADVAFNGSVWVAAGNGGNIYRSTNNAASWEEVLPRPASASLKRLKASGSIWIAVGASQNIFRSADNGVTWSVAHSGGSVTLNDIAYISKTWVAVGDDGLALRSIDNGETWSSINSAALLGRDLVSIATNGSVWIASSADGKFMSTDGGKSWNSISDFFTPGNLKRVMAIDGLWLAVGAGGKAMLAYDLAGLPEYAPFTYLRIK